jgi:hypothetical protein
MGFYLIAIIINVVLLSVMSAVGYVDYLVLSNLQWNSFLDVVIAGLMFSLNLIALLAWLAGIEQSIKIVKGE